MRKPDFCICENKDADQLRYTDRTIPLLSKYEISSFYLSSVTAQPGLYRTWSETPKTGFLTTRLISSRHTEGEHSIETYTKKNKQHREPNPKYCFGTVSNIILLWEGLEPV